MKLSSSFTYLHPSSEEAYKKQTNIPIVCFVVDKLLGSNTLIRIYWIRETQYHYLVLFINSRVIYLCCFSFSRYAALLCELVSK
jgi:hypothetical protein